MLSVDIVSELRAYWNRCRGERPMPARADLDPAQIPALLPNLILIDVAHDPLNFRYRLIGTEVEFHSSEGHTGKWITEIPGRAPPSSVWDNLCRVVEARTPSERTIPYVGPHKEFVTTRQITLPLSDDGATVTMLMIAIEYVRKGASE